MLAMTRGGKAGARNDRRGKGSIRSELPCHSPTAVGGAMGSFQVLLLVANPPCLRGYPRTTKVPPAQSRHLRALLRGGFLVGATLCGCPEPAPKKHQPLPALLKPSHRIFQLRDHDEKGRILANLTKDLQFVVA